jgi:hypothetical protein
MGIRIVLFWAVVFVCFGCGAAIGGDWQSVSVKKDHYLGISPSCASLGEARDKALREVLCQVLRNVGAQYSLKFDSSVVMESSGGGGASYRDNVSRQVSEKFHYKAEAFLSSIEQNVVSSSYKRETGGGVVYRILVYFPPCLVEKARRLSLGAKVVARFVGGREGCVIEVKEVNGIKVVLSGYAISVVEKNRHADFLNYYVMSVSDGGSRTYERAFSDSVVLSGGRAKRIRVMVPTSKVGLKCLVLGTSRSVMVCLQGTDEVGRRVRLQVPIPARF